MRDDIENRPSVLGELGLWVLASVFMTAMAMLAATTAKLLLGWSDYQWWVNLLVLGAASATWGSWAALLWTRNRVLKTLMVAVVVTPPLLVLLAGSWAFLTVPDTRWLWKWGLLVVAAHGLGALAFSLYACTRWLLASATTRAERNRRLAVGWTVFPIVTVAAVVAVVAAGYVLMPDVVGCSDRFVEKLARWTIPSQALVLVTTVLPAGAAHLCHRLAGES